MENHGEVKVMQNIIYAVYGSVEKAHQAFGELLQRGASLLDLVVITQATYQIDARVEDIPVSQDPFGVTPGGIRLLHSLRDAGDLADCLQDMGFGEQAAEAMERTVLEGGAAIILRVPSGALEVLQAWEAIESHGGTILTPIHNRPYLC